MLPTNRPIGGQPQHIRVGTWTSSSSTTRSPQSRLTVMRNKDSGNAEFRNALRELATLLVYEATRGLATADDRDR